MNSSKRIGITREGIQEERRQLRAEYGDLFDSVAAICDGSLTELHSGRCHRPVCSIWLRT
jgi:hypothetical protein